ncbi:unnamed protein product [Linum trigynum]|uniref:Uncharacterized protein n=1 Tax=Linum trigynum TaxID=586398 RepID=A0AAV2D1I0_9ROSI
MTVLTISTTGALSVFDERFEKRNHDFLSVRLSVFKLADCKRDSPATSMARQLRPRKTHEEVIGILLSSFSSNTISISCLLNFNVLLNNSNDVDYYSRMLFLDQCLSGGGVGCEFTNTLWT